MQHEGASEEAAQALQRAALSQDQANVTKAQWSEAWARAQGGADIDEKTIAELLSLMHVRPIDADLDGLRRWESGLEIVIGKSMTDAPCVTFTEDGVQQGFPQYSAIASAALSAGCTIPETHHRGITPRQLIALWEHIKEHCVRERWRSTFAGSLTPERVTLYDCCAYVIKPSTSRRKCSYVELIATNPEAQRPRWFVSHW